MERETNEHGELRGTTLKGEVKDGEAKGRALKTYFPPGVP